MKISLRTKMLVMSFIVVSISVITSGFIMVYSVSDAFEKELGERAMAIGRTVAQMPSIRNNIGQPEGDSHIQPIAERTRIATDVDYIVIIDNERVRYSHPSVSLIGEKFVGGDEGASLVGNEYVSKAKGTLGYSVRAFVPIMDDEGVVQVGVAVVGILLPSFESLVTQYRNDILLSLIWGLLIGLIGSLLLAHNIKKQTLNLEPYEIARVVEERSAVMEGMDMGIIALDEQGKITFMNQLAVQYTRHQKDYKNLHIKELLPQLWNRIVNLLQAEEKEDIQNRNIVLYEKAYLLSLYPIQVKDEIVGLFITMMDRTEANRLAEELTGVKTLVDALRAQNHEYMNKLHSIAGLIQLDRTEKALEVIIDETVDEESVIQFLKDRIEDYSVSGLLLGKRARARELGIYFSIHKDSYLHENMSGLSSGDLVTVIGNLVENAFESIPQTQEHKEVECLIQGNVDDLYISVSDNGTGIPKENQEQIFMYGFSTKGKEGRGIGLSLVKNIIDSQEGKILIHSAPNEGTQIQIEVKRGEKA
ncbi:ATP-binding protein [Bacillus pinisoli]|uniref:ATP-binding protein n=1 Tax=Bacillus pinisoli TaxID=2901866 RepID=UPI001FF3FB9A|nr:sensor histidine kinase [Bacillus pinisoli]